MIEFWFDNSYDNKKAMKLEKKIEMKKRKVYMDYPEYHANTYGEDELFFRKQDKIDAEKEYSAHLKNGIE